MSRRSDRPVSFHGRPNRRARRLLRVLRVLEVRPDTVHIHGSTGPGPTGCLLLDPEVAQLTRDGLTRTPPFPVVVIAHDAAKRLRGLGARLVSSPLVPPGTAILLGAPLTLEPAPRNSWPMEAFSVGIRPARAAGLITNIGPDLPPTPGPSAPSHGASNG